MADSKMMKEDPIDLIDDKPSLEWDEWDEPPNFSAETCSKMPHCMLVVSLPRFTLSSWSWMSGSWRSWSQSFQP